MRVRSGSSSGGGVRCGYAVDQSAVVRHANGVEQWLNYGFEHILRHGIAPHHADLPVRDPGIHGGRVGPIARWWGRCLEL